MVINLNSKERFYVICVRVIDGKYTVPKSELGARRVNDG